MSIRSLRLALSISLGALAAAAAAGCTPTRAGTETSPTADGDPAARGGAPAVAIDAGIDAPLTLDRDLPTLARRSAELLEALADALAATPSDCPALAERVRTIMAEHREVRVAAAAAVDRGDGRALDREVEAHATRIEAAAARMKPALTACGGDADFAAALTPMDVP